MKKLESPVLYKDDFEYRRDGNSWLCLYYLSKTRKCCTKRLPKCIKIIATKTAPKGVKWLKVTSKSYSGITARLKGEKSANFLWTYLAFNAWLTNCLDHDLKYLHIKAV